MKLTLNIEFDSQNDKEINALGKIFEIVKGVNVVSVEQPTEDSYEAAWKECSWEIITLALLVIKLHDGDAAKGIYALFDSLLKPENERYCSDLNERSISSRVGRTAVICKELGNFRLMEIAVRRKDKQKRVFVPTVAADALIKLLQGEFGDYLNTYLMESGLDQNFFKEL